MQDSSIPSTLSKLLEHGLAKDHVMRIRGARAHACMSSRLEVLASAS